MSLARKRRTLVFASATHVWSDLFYALLVPLLVLMKEDPELELSFGEVGLLRTVHAGASAALQVPFGFLAERVGVFWLVLGGNIWVAAGLVVLAGVSSLPLLLSVTLVGGLGGGTQHPLATSLVSRVYETGRRSAAVGAVNFAGDLGKMAAPVAALLLAVPFGWRATLRLVGLSGIGFMLLSILARGSVDAGRPKPLDRSEAGDSVGAAKMGGYINLSLVGFLDSAGRATALTFLPFLMRDKGMSTEQIFGMLFLLLGGGAVGKFICGWLDERYGSVRLIWGTKGLTAILLFVSLSAPTAAMAPLLVILGIGLNGTSSVLYASVAKFVPPPLRARFYGFFYTTNEVGGSIAPFLYGLVADLLSIRWTIAVLGLATVLILPVSLTLRKHLGRTDVDSDSSTPFATGLDGD